MGILDPPGFDDLSRKNSFEQLISNITNEQLAYHSSFLVGYGIHN